MAEEWMLTRDPGARSASGGPRTELTGAGFGIRAVARIIDTLMMFPLGFVGGLLGVLLLVLLRSLGLAELPADFLQRLQNSHWVLTCFALLGGLLYHTVCETVHGATLGKFCCGLRVVSEEDGERATLKTALIRNLAYLIDSLFFGLVGYGRMEKSSARQRYGDAWGHTVVVKKATVTAWPRQTAARFLLGLTLGFVTAAAAMSLSYLLIAFH